MKMMDKLKDSMKAASGSVKKAAGTVKKAAGAVKKTAVSASSGTKTRITRSIRAKLLVSFLVPVLLVMVLGISSYEKSKAALIDSFKNTAKSTIESTGNYFDLVTKIVESKAEQVLSVNSLNSYFGGGFETGSDDEKLAKSNIQGMLKQVAEADDMTLDVSILTYAVNKSMSSNGSYLILGTTGAEGFDGASEGRIMKNLGTDTAWIGIHSYIDSFGMSNGDYSMVYVKSFHNSIGEKIGYSTADVNTEIVKNSLAQINLGETSKFALVTRDGNETTRNGLVGNIFYGTDFYKYAVNSTEISGSSYEKMDGVKYLCLFYKIGDTGAMLCGRIAESEIVKTAESIKLITLVITILCVVVSVLIGLFVSLGFSRTIDATVDVLGKTNWANCRMLRTGCFTIPRNSLFRLRMLRTL